MDEGDGDDCRSAGHADLLEKAGGRRGAGGHWHRPRLPGEGGIGAIGGGAEAHDDYMGLELGGCVMGRVAHKK